MLSACGVALTTWGLLLAARSALLLLGRGRPSRGKRPRFVIAGPYRRARNPLFLGVLAALTGVAVAQRSVPLGATAAILAFGLHLWVIWVEEPRLLVRFGPAYAAYLEHVPRWIGRRRRV